MPTHDGFSRAADGPVRRRYRLLAGRSVGILCRSLLVAALVCFSLGAADPEAHFTKLGGKLMCTCGCAQSLLGCDHAGCPSRGEEMDLLRTGIASGQSDESILAQFVQNYGTVVLAAPTTQGFDLVAWIMPFAVAAVALIGTIFLVRHWSKQQTTLAKTATMGTRDPVAEETMRERIRRETGTD